MIFQICEADGSSAVTCNEKPWWQFMAFLFAHTHAHIRCSFPSETRIKYAYANAHTHSRLHKRTYAHKHIWFPVEHLREGTVRIVPSIAPDRQGSLKPGVRSPVNATRQLFAASGRISRGLLATSATALWNRADSTRCCPYGLGGTGIRPSKQFPWYGNGLPPATRSSRPVKGPWVHLACIHEK
jgi:hypothetical protein